MSSQPALALPVTLSELESHLWEAANILRGSPVDRTDWKSYILPLLFFKRICDVWDEEHSAMLAEYGEDFADEHRFQVPEGCHWSNVRRAPKNVGTSLANAMRGVEAANQQHLYGVFGDAQWTNKDRLPDDDSSVVAKEDPKIAKGRQQGKAEAIDSLVQRAREELADLGDVASLVEEQDRLMRIETALQAATGERDTEQAHASPLEAKRRAAWTQLRAVESTLNVLMELQKRFDLLQEQYESDLRRLEAISEAGSRLEQLKETRCPMCGAVAEHHDNVHRAEALAEADVSRACQAEAAKTNALLQDLQATRTSTTAHVERLAAERDERQAEFDAAAGELKAVLEQRVDVASKKVDEVRMRRDACKKVVDVLERIQVFETLLAEVKGPLKRERADGPASMVSTAQAEPFSKAVESLLRAWHFPNLDRVTFSEKSQDVVISGRARTSHGKGVRAITRAAFNLALLRHCVDEERPFPNLVLIDSPLLVYEKPDPGETEFPQDVKHHFWESVKSSFTDAQVIILENHRQLPTDGIANVNVALFTGNDQGRRGFIPRVGGAP